MPRSRSRKKRGRQDRAPRVPDSSVLTHLLELLNLGGYTDELSDLLLLDAFERAAWSFYRGAGPRYADAGTGSLEHNLARLRAREWFLFELELPSGLTAAEEWVASREGEPGSGAERRAVTRFINGECGVFDVRDIRPDGWIFLSPLPNGDPVIARPIARGLDMLPGQESALPDFAPGETIAGRLYWLDDDRAELSAGTTLVSTAARARLLADPPRREELLSGLALEAALGADASTLLSSAAEPCFPSLVQQLLSALSDGTFDYRRLWRELEGEPDPIAVTRQLLWELDGWTEVEPELLARAVVGAWLRRREADAGRSLTPETLSRERRLLEDHVRTVLDVPAEPAWPEAAARTQVAMSDDDVASIAKLEADETEWVIDVMPADWGQPHVAAFSPAPFPLAVVIVEQPSSPSDDAEDTAAGAGEDEEDQDESANWNEGAGNAGDEDAHDAPPVDEGDFVDELDEDELASDEFGADEWGESEWGAGGALDALDEEVPRLLHQEIIHEGGDEAAVALVALVRMLRAEGRTTRPGGIIFRQRTLAARIGETLRDAGIDVALLHFSEATEAAILDAEAEEDERSVAEHAKRHVGQADVPAVAVDVEPASEAERQAYGRLVAAARRARPGLEDLKANAGEQEEVAFLLTLAKPLQFPFSTLEGSDERVSSMAAVVDARSEELALRLHLAAPGAESRFECHGPDGELLVQTGDTLMIEIRDAGDDEEPFPDLLRRAGLGPPPDGPRVVATRFRFGTPPAFLRGEGLDLAAGIMEAAATLTERVGDEDEPAFGEAEPFEFEANVEPLGRVRVEWPGRA